MARVKLIVDKEDIAPEHHALFDTLAALRGRISGPSTVVLHSPGLARPWNEISEYLHRESIVEPQHAELAVCATARERDCGYVWNAHVPLARKAGIAAETIATVRERRPVDDLPDPARVVVLYVQQLLRNNRVESAVFDRAPEGPRSEVAGRADGLDRPLCGPLRNPERLRGHARGAARGPAGGSRARRPTGEGAPTARRAARHADHPPRPGRRGASVGLRRGRRRARQRARSVRHLAVQPGALPAPPRRRQLPALRLAAPARAARAGHHRDRPGEGLPLRLGGARARGPEGGRQRGRRHRGA